MSCDFRRISVPHPYHFIADMRARSCTSERLAHVVKQLRSHGISLQTETVTTPEEATRSARRICREEENPVIIIGGGDGAINRVVNGLAFGRATVGIIPFGAVNVLARELGIRSLDVAIERIVAGATRSPSIGLLQTGHERQHFLLMAGIGLDGSIFEAAHASGHPFSAWKTYLKATVHSLKSWGTGRVEIFVDDMRIDCHGLIVCKAAHYGGPLILAPQADLFTPEFQVICIKDDRRRSYLKLILNTITKRSPDSIDIRSFTTAKLVVSGKMATQIDGCFHTSTPARISIVEQFFHLIS